MAEWVTKEPSEASKEPFWLTKVLCSEKKFFGL